MSTIGKDLTFSSPSFDVTNHFAPSEWPLWESCLKINTIVLVLENKIIVMYKLKKKIKKMVPIGVCLQIMRLEAQLHSNLKLRSSIDATIFLQHFQQHNKLTSLSSYLTCIVLIAATSLTWSFYTYAFSFHHPKLAHAFASDSPIALWFISAHFHLWLIFK